MPPRKHFLAVAALLSLAATCASAEPQKHKPRKYPPHEAATAPVPRAPSQNPCAQFGAGFVRAPGSDTCIKIGGSVGIEAGGRF